MLSLAEPVIRTITFCGKGSLPQISSTDSSSALGVVAHFKDVTDLSPKSLLLSTQPISILSSQFTMSVTKILGRDMCLKEGKVHIVVQFHNFNN